MDCHYSGLMDLYDTGAWVFTVLNHTADACRWRSYQECILLTEFTASLYSCSTAASYRHRASRQPHLLSRSLTIDWSLSPASRSPACAEIALNGAFVADKRHYALVIFYPDISVSYATHWN